STPSTTSGSGGGASHTRAPSRHEAHPAAHAPRSDVVHAFSAIGSRTSTRPSPSSSAPLHSVSIPSFVGRGEGEGAGAGVGAAGCAAGALAWALADGIGGAGVGGAWAPAVGEPRQLVATITAAALLHCAQRTRNATMAPTLRALGARRATF